MMAGVVFSQVGIGIRAPHKSALLELKASEGEYRGVLIPRIPLKDLTDVSQINRGDVATSLLVFNTTTNNVLGTGFYYWSGAKWVRLINNQDIIDNIDTFPRNKVLEVRGDVLVLEDTKGLKVDTPIQDLNIITTIKEGENGTYVYKNEAGEESVINITGSVIENITEILNNTEVKEEIYNTVAAQGKAITAKDNSITLVGGNKAVLEETQIAVTDGGITTAKIAAGGKKQILITNAKGEVVWVDATDEVIIDAVKNNETVTVLLDKGNGTFEYYNEKAIDAKGNLIATKAVKFNANTLSIVERKGKEQGIYDFFDGEHKDTPLMTISTRANSIYFDNSSTVIEGDNLQQVIENIITQIEVAQGTPSTIKGGTEILINGEKELADAVLKEMTLSIAPGAITTEKIEAGGNKQILITNAKGEVVWVDATDEVIIDAVKHNETVTVLLDKGNGTFEYYNEKAIDAKGNLIADKAVKFNANTLSIIEVLGEDKKGTGVFNFYDKSQEAPIATINVPESVINNIVEILSDESVVNVIYDKVAAKGKAVTSLDGSIQIDNGGQAALNAMQISIAEGGVTPNKIQSGGNKQILVTNAQGKVEWVDVKDEVIKEAVKANETITVLHDNENGTFTYYDENDVDENGNVIKGKGVTFDANTLRIVERKDVKEKGIYDFYDGMTSLNNPLMTISTRANAIYFDNNTTIVEGDNLQVVVENIIKKIEIAQGKPETLKGEGILVNGQPELTGSVLKEMLLTIANGAITEKKIADGAVTTYKINNEAVTTEKIAPGTDKYLLVTKEGKVQWVPAKDNIITEVVKQNETITVLDTTKDNGTFIYYNESDFDNEGKLIGEGTSFDANTLTIENDGKGKYIFRDGKTKTGAPLAEIDILGTVIENITEILSNTDVKEQIFETVAAQGNELENADHSILVEGGEKAVLANAKISVASKGITTDKIAPGTDKYLLVTKGDKVEWVPATDSIIQEVVKENETLTLLIDEKNGTFTYYNEEGIDANGNEIKGKGVLFNANTLKIYQKEDGKGVYVFYDGQTTIEQPLMKINVIEDVVNNITEIVENETVVEAIYQKIAAKGVAATPEDTSIIIKNGDNAVLNEMQIAVAPKGITTAKIAPGDKKGQLLVTNGQGEVQWMDATDDIIKDILKGNQAITLIKDSGKGTFVYYNESCFDNEGNLTKPENGIEFNANTLTIKEVLDVDQKGTGTFNFYDLSKEEPIATINVTASVINNIDEILKDTTVQTNIYTTVARQGKEMQSTDQSLLIVGGEKAGLSKVSIDINKEGVTTEKIKDQAVTVSKMSSAGAGGEKRVLISGLNNEVHWEELGDIVENTAGNLTTDNIVEVLGSDGVNAVLKNTKLGIREGSITNKQITNNTITIGKLDSEGSEPGMVMVSNATGGFDYVDRETIKQKGEDLRLNDGLEFVVGNGVSAVLAETVIRVKDSGINEPKLAQDAVTTSKIKSQAVTTEKIAPNGVNKLLGTDKNGIVKWIDAKDELINIIFDSNESVTLLHDHQDGTFTYYNEKEVDSQGNLLPNAKGVTFNANTLSITSPKAGVYEFRDQSEQSLLATIDTRAKSIVFEDNTNIEYNNVEEAIISLTKKIEQLENLDIEKANLSGEGILVNGKISETDAVFKNVALSIADEAVTPQKIKGGTAKQLLVTNESGKAQWVDATDDIIKDLVQTNETVTVLENLGNGTFIYFSESDYDKDGNKVGEGVKFDANTLTILDKGKGVYEFYDQSSDKPLAIVDIQGTVVENIKEILNHKEVKEEIYNTVAAQGKEVFGDTAIEIVDGEKAVLNAMTVSLRNGGVTSDKIAPNAVTEEKLFAGQDKKDYIPVVQSDGSVKYQPLTTVVAGEMLSVDQSLEITGEGDASKALLQKLGLQVRAGGIGNKHIQNLAITSDKINSLDAGIGSILTADGSGNAKFETIEEAIAPAMHGDMVTDGSLNIKNGENVLFGDKDTQVTIKINEGGVVNKHLDVNAVTNEKILDKTIEAAKLNGGEGGANRVAITTADGGVEYKALSTNIITGKGQIKTDGIITASDNGVDKVLADVTLSVANKSITADKFNAEDAPKGAVATVTANGTVKYQLVDSSDLANKGNITTDNALTVSDGVGKVLSDVMISVKEKGITNDKLAEKAVTANKISSEGIGEKRVLISGKDAEVFWGELGDIVTNTAGNLKTDGIIILTEGTGVNTLLADAELSIANNSITSDKLSSKENNIPVGKDKILVTNDAGGFDYVAKGAFESGGEDLYVGSALEFVNSDGLNAVLVETTIDVKNQGISTEKIAEGAVTKAKISSVGAKENAVLTADGSGKVDYKALSTTAFEGKGANLLADESIQVLEGNQALLKETKIAIAELGVDNKHIKGNAVTSDKIGSNSSAEGTLLAADGNGNTAFKTLSEIAIKQGKALTTKDNSLTVNANNKAVLQDLDIAITTGGVKEKHIGNREVTAQKIGADGGKGRVLTTNGQGGASFESLEVSISEAGKKITEGAGIAIVGGEKAVLKDVTISVADKGINTVKLADNAVTTDKIANDNVTNYKIKDGAVTTNKMSAGNATIGHVLTVEKDGKVAFKASGGSQGSIKESETIKANNGTNAVLKDVTLEIKGASIQTGHIADYAVTHKEIGDNAIHGRVIAKQGIDESKIDADNAKSGQVLMANSNGGAYWGDVKAGTEISTGDFLKSNTIEAEGDGDGAFLKDLKFNVKGASIGQDHLTYDAVGTGEIQNEAVTDEKISSKGAEEGDVLIANNKGGVYWGKPAGGNDSGNGDFEESDTIEVEGDGDGAFFKDLKFNVRGGSIAQNHLAYDAVGTEEIKNEAVTDKKINSDGAEQGDVLVSDGRGGARWQKITGGGSDIASPKFFYLPAIYVEMVSGRSTSIELYDEYKEQFGSPMLSSNESSTLPVYGKYDLNYYVTYYDKNVFEDVKLDTDGELHYTVKQGAKPTGRTFFNIVLEVKE